MFSSLWILEMSPVSKKLMTEFFQLSFHFIGCFICCAEAFPFDRILRVNFAIIFGEIGILSTRANFILVPRLCSFHGISGREFSYPNHQESVWKWNYSNASVHKHCSVCKQKHLVKFCFYSQSPSQVTNITMATSPRIMEEIKSMNQDTLSAYISVLAKPFYSYIFLWENFKLLIQLTWWL